MDINAMKAIQSAQAVSSVSENQKVNYQPKVDMESKDTVNFSTKVENPKGNKTKKIGAGIASFVYPGLGQLVNGDAKKAAKFALGGVGLDVIGTIASVALAASNPIACIAIATAFALGHVGLNIASIVDAVKSAGNE